MRGRLDFTTRFPIMKVLVDFDNTGFSNINNWTDITDYVTDISGSKEKESQVLGGVSSDIITFTIDNSDNKFSVDNPDSFFYQKSKSKLRFALMAGFKGETLTPYIVGYTGSLTPKWKTKEYLLKATCPMEKLKRTPVPQDAFYGVGWDELVNALLDQANIEPYFTRDIPKTNLYYKYFKFEDDNCFEALKSLMQVVAGQAFFEGSSFKAITKLAIDYVENRDYKHDIRVDDFFEFDEIIDDNSIINTVTITSNPKEVAPLQVVWETPDNFVSVQNEQIVYDGTDYIYIKADNKPLYWDEEHDIQIKDLTNGQDITWDVYNAELGRIKLDANGLSLANPNDVLSVSYTYQYLVLLPGQQRTYIAKTDDPVDVFLEPDVIAWNADASAQVPYSSTPDTPNTVSKQSMVIKEGGTVVELTLKNNTSDKVAISTLQLRGYPIKVLNPLEVNNKNQESINEYDVKEQNIENNYINNIDLAQKLSQFIVDNYSEIKKKLDIQISGYSELLLNDVALVTESNSGTNHLMTIEKIDFTFNVNNGWTANLELLEVPSDDWAYGGFTGDSYWTPINGIPGGKLPYYKGPEPPIDHSLFWVDTSSTPYITKVYDANQNKWIPSTPITAEEIGAETPQGAQDKADRAEQNAKEYADAIQYVGKNLIKNSTFKYIAEKVNPDDPDVPQDWSQVDSSWIILPPEDDKPESPVLSTSATGRSSDVIDSAYSNYFVAHTADTFAFATDFKVTSVSAWDVQIPFVVEFYDSNYNLMESHNVTLSDLGITISDDTWVRGSFIYTVTNPNVEYGRIRLTLFRNGEIFFREIKVEKGNKSTDYTPSPFDAEKQYSLLETRTSNLEIKVSDESIITTVTSSTQYQNDLASKADAEALGDLATKDEVEQAKEDAQSYTDQQIQNIDFSPYATKTDLELTSDAITQKIEKLGGANLLNNSIGLAGFDFWNGNTDGSKIMIVTDPSLSRIGIDSAFYFPPIAAGSDRSIEQNVNVMVGTTYTMSWFINKANNGDPSNNDGAFAIQILENGQLMYNKLYASDQSTIGFESGSFNYIPTSNVITVRIYGYGLAEVVISGLMFNLGDIALRWSTSTGELYNTNVRADINGVRVSRLDADGNVIGYTNMTPSEFAGYYDTDGNGTFEKVFYLNEDETVTKRFRALDEITMGTVKIVNVNSGGLQGWAFVPVVPE